MSDVLQRLAHLSAQEKRELLAKMIRQAPAPSQPAPRTLPTVQPAPQDRYKPFPLTPIQQAYWVGRSSAFELGNVGSHVYFEVDMPRMDLERSSLALQRVIDRHDMLRVVIRPDGTQEVLTDVPAYQLGITDVRRLPTAEATRQVEAVRDRMSRQVVPLDQWPLFEVHASCLDEQRTRLHFSFDLVIADLRSIQILLAEWLQLYVNPSHPLPSLGISFRDYVLADLAWQDSEVCQRSQQYWHKRLPDLPPAPELPVVKPPSAVEKPSFVRRSYRLEPELWSRLKQRARKHNLTPATVLLAAFGEVLTTWARRPSFTLNLVLFNRLGVHPQVNDIIGEFTSVLLLGVDNTGTDSFQSRATRMQQQFWNDLDHRHYHGVNVLRDLARMQGGAPSALMPIVFTCDLVHDFMASPQDTSTQIPVELVNGLSQTPQVYLDHQAFEQAGALVINWDAVDELFPDGLILDMFEAERGLLHRLAEDDGPWLEPTGSLIPNAQLEVRAAANATDAPIVEDLLHARFADQVRVRPEHPAVVTAGRTLSYAELSRRAARVSQQLIERKSPTNALVGVVMEKGWEQIVAVLGILQAGSAYLPIDPELPEDRVRFLLEDGKVRHVFTQPWWKERLTWPAGVEALVVDEADDEHDSAEAPLAPLQRPDDLAYVIYTSGSTGSPKGVMIDHRAALNPILDINRRFHVGPEDRVFALSSLSFDLSVYDIFGPLAAGATIVMPEAAAARDPGRWVEQMTRERVTIWDSVPVLMEMLVQHVLAESGALPDSLRVVMLSGDWIPLTLPPQIKTLGSDIRLFSLGGATEASIWSILYPIEEIDPEWKSVPYGKPMVNQRFHVLNDALQPSPVWVPGYLHIGGVGVARGYWGDEEKTRASFITHPQTGERLYRTGDLGRYLPDGNIEFLGREDFQVKIRGHRIELGEIEATIRQYPGVRDVIVSPVGKDRGSRRLVAYVVGSDDLASEVDSLRAFLRTKLPDYMVPVATVLLPVLPITSNGKIDRKALPDPAAASQPRHVSVVPPIDAAPASGARELIGKIVAEALSLDTVSPDDELSVMGIDSVGLIQISARLNETFGFRPTMADMFRLTTVAALADYYQERRQAGAHPSNGVDIGANPSLSESSTAFSLLVDPTEREAFKHDQRNVRNPCAEGPEPSVSLPGLSDESVLEIFSRRRSQRQFSQNPLALDQLGGLLSVLHQRPVNGVPTYLYGSGGSLYPVQTYVHVKRDRVAGVTEGIYYYHPQDHRLVLMTGDFPLYRGIHSPANRTIFDESAFSIFLIGRLSAIAPIYGEASTRFALIEAGLISQLLEMTAPTARLGLCQIGTLDFDSIRSAFALEDTDIFLHALVGGEIPAVTEREEGVL